MDMDVEASFAESDIGSEAVEWTPAIGELVWAKVKSHPWWPARVFDPAQASQSARLYEKKDHHLIAFFGDGTFNWMKAKDVLPFSPYFKEKEPLSHLKLFISSVDDAIAYLDEQLENGFDCAPAGTVEQVAGESTEADSMDAVRLVDFVKAVAINPLGRLPDVAETARLRRQAILFRNEVSERPPADDDEPKTKKEKEESEMGNSRGKKQGLGKESVASKAKKRKKGSKQIAQEADVGGSKPSKRANKKKSGKKKDLEDSAVAAGSEAENYETSQAGNAMEIDAEAVRDARIKEGDSNSAAEKAEAVEKKDINPDKKMQHAKASAEGNEASDSDSALLGRVAASLAEGELAAAGKQHAKSPAAVAAMDISPEESRNQIEVAYSHLLHLASSPLVDPGASELAAEEAAVSAFMRYRETVFVNYSTKASIPSALSSPGSTGGKVKEPADVSSTKKVPVKTDSAAAAASAATKPKPRVEGGAIKKKKTAPGVVSDRKLKKTAAVQGGVRKSGNRPQPKVATQDEGVAAGAEVEAGGVAETGKVAAAAAGETVAAAGESGEAVAAVAGAGAAVEAAAAAVESGGAVTVGAEKDRRHESPSMKVTKQAVGHGTDSRVQEDDSPIPSKDGSMDLTAEQDGSSRDSDRAQGGQDPGPAVHGEERRRDKQTAGSHAQGTATLRIRDNLNGLRLLQMLFFADASLPSEAKLRTLFLHIGGIEFVRVNASTRFGLVRFERQSQAEAALEEVKQGKVLEFSLVEKAQIRSPHDTTPVRKHNMSQFSKADPRGAYPRRVELPAMSPPLGTLPDPVPAPVPVPVSLPPGKAIKSALKKSDTLESNPMLNLPRSPPRQASAISESQPHPPPVPSPATSAAPSQTRPWQWPSQPLQQPWQVGAAAVGPPLPYQQQKYSFQEGTPVPVPVPQGHAPPALAVPPLLPLPPAPVPAAPVSMASSTFPALSASGSGMEQQVDVSGNMLNLLHQVNQYVGSQAKQP